MYIVLLYLCCMQFPQVTHHISIVMEIVCFINAFTILVIYIEIFQFMIKYRDTFYMSVFYFYRDHPMTDSSWLEHLWFTSWASVYHGVMIWNSWIRFNSLTSVLSWANKHYFYTYTIPFQCHHADLLFCSESIKTVL